MFLIKDWYYYATSWFFVQFIVFEHILDNFIFSLLPPVFAPFFFHCAETVNRTRLQACNRRIDNHRESAYYDYNCVSVPVQGET